MIPARIASPTLWMLTARQGRSREFRSSTAHHAPICCELQPRPSGAMACAQWSAWVILGGRESNMFSKAIIGLTLATMAVSQPVAAKAPKGLCPNLWKMYGDFMRASLLCNFPESNAIRKTLYQIKMHCSQMTESEARVYLADGFHEFDKELAAKGHPRACGDIFTFMDAIGG
jgi:hypothetical protein